MILTAGSKPRFVPKAKPLPRRDTYNCYNDAMKNTSKKLTETELIEAIHRSFKAERLNDIEDGLTLLAPDFKRVSMLVSGDVAFPTLQGDAITDAMKRAYAVVGREFHIISIAANEMTQTVFVELIEVEPRKDSTAVWPYVLVCIFEDGRIKRTRHYGDPSILEQSLAVDDVKSAYL